MLGRERERERKSERERKRERERDRKHDMSIIRGLDTIYVVSRSFPGSVVNRKGCSCADHPTKKSFVEASIWSLSFSS